MRMQLLAEGGSLLQDAAGIYHNISMIFDDASIRRLNSQVPLSFFIPFGRDDLVLELDELLHAVFVRYSFKVLLDFA